jgi:hypothetical protein
MSTNGIATSLKLSEVIGNIMKTITKKIWELNEGDKVRFPKSYEQKIAYTDRDGNTTHRISNDVCIDRYPSFFLDVASHSGVVTSVKKSEIDKGNNYDELIATIKLDKHYSELDEWDNNIEFYGEPNNTDGCIENYDMEIIKENK